MADGAITAMSRAMGALLVVAGALVAIGLFMLCSLPSKWRRADGVVEQTDGVRAVVSYEAAEAGERHTAYLHLPGAETGQAVGIIYRVDSPATYDHAGVRWTTLIAAGAPLACAAMVLGAALIA